MVDSHSAWFLRCRLAKIPRTAFIQLIRERDKSHPGTFIPQCPLGIWFNMLTQQRKKLNKLAFLGHLCALHQFTGISDEPKNQRQQRDLVDWGQREGTGPCWQKLGIKPALTVIYNFTQPIASDLSCLWECSKANHTWCLLRACKWGVN